MNSQLVDMILSSATLRRGTFEKKRILISGGAGFLGSWLCEALLFLGAKVDCIDNLSTGQLENIATMKSDEHFRFMKMDVCNPIDLHNRYDYVVHFASRPSP